MVSSPLRAEAHIPNWACLDRAREPNALRKLGATCPCTLCLPLLTVIYRFAHVIHGEQTFRRTQVGAIDIVRH